MKENTIISLADANYFELLNELVDSINRFEQSKKLDICIMDAGLTDDQIKIATYLLQTLCNYIKIHKSRSFYKHYSTLIRDTASIINQLHDIIKSSATIAKY